MSDSDLKKFLSTVQENYRFTTSLDLEILGRVASDLSLAEAESILTRVREADADPGRLSLPAFAARARAMIDHRNLKPSTPRRLIDFVRNELGAGGCDGNGELLDAASCISKYYEHCWKKLKELPDSPWRERFRRILRRQVITALVELNWDEKDAEAVAALLVEMPLEEPVAEPKLIGSAGLQL